MALVRIDTVEHACQLVSRQVQDAYPHLTLHFVIHNKSQLTERLALSEHEIARHPAGQKGIYILKKAAYAAHSSFLGIAIERERGFMGLTSKDKILALFNINTDDFHSVHEVQAYLYHLIWHAIDLMDIQNRPEYRKKFKTGPMIPKRSPMNLAKANLQADVFASVMGGLIGDSDTLNILAKRRAENSLLAISATRAEDFPFIIAMEATEFAYAQLDRKSLPKSRYLETARKISLDIGYTFEEVSIRQWWAFSEPAQDMAWRGIGKADILGAAVYTSEDPYVRATAYLISEVTGTVPVPSFDLEQTYNAFADEERNKLLHREMMEKAFQEAIELGLEEESGQPLLNAANAQNEGLTEGHIIGWCASALQSAAKAFEQAVATGMAPEQAARLEFEGAKAQISWEAIRELGSSIVDQRRKGHMLTLGHIAEICNEHPLFAPVLGSLKITMNDPGYIRKLEAANDLSLGAPAPGPATPDLAPKGPAPKSPGPKGPAPKTPDLAPPTYIAPPPGLGINRSTQIMRQRYLAQKKMQEDKDGGDDSNTTKH